MKRALGDTVADRIAYGIALAQKRRRGRKQDHSNDQQDYTGRPQRQPLAAELSGFLAPLHEMLLSQFKILYTLLVNLTTYLLLHRYYATAKDCRQQLVGFGQRQKYHFKASDDIILLRKLLEGKNGDQRC
jgi:hypothetical protein